MSVNDPLAGPKDEVESIVGIAKIVLNGEVVGFVYRTASGRFYAQALSSMPYDDQARAGLVIASKAALQRPHFEMYSGMKRISTLPWPNMTLIPCR